MTVTGMPALNAIRAVVDAPPGIVTSADLPLRAFAGRFADRLRGHRDRSRYPFPAVPRRLVQRRRLRRHRRPGDVVPLQLPRTASWSRSAATTARCGSSTPTARTSAPTSASADGCAATGSSARSTAGGSTATARSSRSPGSNARPPRVSAGTWDVLRAQRPHLRLAPRRRRAAPVRRDAPTGTTAATWTPWHVNTYRVRIGLQDLTENIIDRSHFWTVHDMEPPDDDRSTSPSTGRRWWSTSTSRSPPSATRDSRSTPARPPTGPGIVAVEVREGALDMLTYITQTPVDDEITEITIHFSMKALDDEEATESIAELNDRDHQPPVHPGRPHLGEQDLPGAAAAHPGRRPGRPVPPLVPAVLLSAGFVTHHGRTPSVTARSTSPGRAPIHRHAQTGHSPRSLVAMGSAASDLAPDRRVCAVDSAWAWAQYRAHWSGDGMALPRGFQV